MKNIITDYIHPPIPIRNHDWMAWYEGEEESESLVGYGKTKEEAIKDLKEWTDAYNAK